MENKEILEKLDEFFDNWIDGTRPEKEDYEMMDKILNTFFMFIILLFEHATLLSYTQHVTTCIC